MRFLKENDLIILFLYPTVIWLTLPFTDGGITIGSLVISYIIAFITIGFGLMIKWSCERRS
jgi:hypothetical protein